ncbi:GntP family permease [Pontixanthobacter aquaemixtae]|uniref:GntP family permease n=1 Tax=Pontixanthobacter aquaemixtae TaxID=1958940 RepID=A0A845A204_9SPHN|nr:GntP family permease [Pontixanthobacter aquaemixtae]MXO91669.1 GntP family permease [Pontixanthobacter aquaemixtae]
MIAILGLFLGMGLLIWLALRDVNIIFAAVLCAMVVILTNGLPFAQSINDTFLFGDLGAFTFAGRFFLLFAAGAMFGRVMSESHAATSIAMALVNALGAQRALWITVLSGALLTYGGVVVFVVIFAMYPLGLRLFQAADLPKRLFCGAITLGAGTFTLTALPGTPSIHNVIPTLKLGTDLFAAPLLGIFGGAIMFILGMFYLEHERKKAIANGEGFEPGPNDSIPSMESIAKDVPHWGLAMIPLVLVIGTILAPRFAVAMGADAEAGWIAFASSQPVLWPSFALALASLVAVILFSSARAAPVRLMGNGVQDSIIPLLATSAVIGFGGVVAQTGGFAAFTQAIVGADMPPLVSMFAATSTISGITGSSSGGLQIFMATFADSYLAMGVSPEEIHRLAAMASGGFDSLPHCGAVIVLLQICQLTHRQAYKDIGVVTVIVPVIATLLTLALAMIV